MLNNNVGIPNNPVGVVPGVMVHHGTPSHPHAPPVHSSGGTITVTNVPFGGPAPHGGGPPIGIRQPPPPHHHRMGHPRPPAPPPPQPPQPPPPLSSTPSASTSNSTVVNSNIMEVDIEVDTTPLNAAELQILSTLDRYIFVVKMYFVKLPLS